MQSNILSFSSHGTVLMSTGYRVLLAEDDAEFRRLLATLLESDGYDVQQAADGQQVVEWLAYWSDLGPMDANCSLIISDIRMPGYSGLDVLTSLHCLGSQIPVILRSGIWRRRHATPGCQAWRCGISLETVRYGRFADRGTERGNQGDRAPSICT